MKPIFWLSYFITTLITAVCVVYVEVRICHADRAEAIDSNRYLQATFLIIHWMYCIVCAQRENMQREWHLLIGYGFICVMLAIGDGEAGSTSPDTTASLLKAMKPPLFNLKQ